jgi:penicillin-binding protein 1A
VIVLSVEDRNGQVLEEFVPVREAQLAMPRAESLQLVNVMRGVIDEGTGAAIRQRYVPDADVAGKTGTTQDYTDGWFILMHPQLVAGARVGFNDNQVTMGPGARAPAARCRSSAKSSSRPCATAGSIRPSSSNIPRTKPVPRERQPQVRGRAIS